MPDFNRDWRMGDEKNRAEVVVESKRHDGKTSSPRFVHDLCEVVSILCRYITSLNE
jgi:hypothetical protein